MALLTDKLVDMKKRWDQFVLIVVVCSLIHLILDTTPGFSATNQFLLLVVDGIITIIFLVDLFLKIKELIRNKQNNPFTFLRIDLIIDILSILPFFIALIVPGLKYIAIIRLLRLMRFFRLLNNMKSNTLIINAIKNKRYELYISMQLVIVITIILSAILYFVENPSQPENFSSITDAFLWSISKFIGEIGGYGDFAPITILGKILATFVGILGIALFAVPAGIIASGFVEEIESTRKTNELNETYKTLSKAFHFDILAGQRAKSKIGLGKTRRRFISLVDAVVKLNKSESHIFEVAGLNKQLKLSKRLKPSGDEEILIEYFDNNSIYGTFVNRNSNITIVSPHSNDGFNLGHYSYCLAEFLNANYLSVEKFGINSFLEETNINFNENNYYIEDFDFIDNDVFKEFIQDLMVTVQKHSFVFNIGSSMGNSPSFHILTGSKKEDPGINPHGTITDIKTAQKIYNDMEVTANKVGLTTTTNSHYTNDVTNHLDWYISNKLEANAMSIKVNVELIKGGHEKYYESIGILGNSIKENCK